MTKERFDAEFAKLIGMSEDEFHAWLAENEAMSQRLRHVVDAPQGQGKTVSSWRGK